MLSLFRPHPWPIMLGACLLGAACTTTRDAAVPLVRVRANTDLQCPDGDITVKSQLGGRYLAKGCGRTAMYNSACEGLQCEVWRDGEEAPGWKDRPDPLSLEGEH